MHITSKIKAYPFKLLWLAHADADQACHKRKEVCKDLLEASEESLHVTTRKVRRVFRRELEEGKAAGKIPMTLYAPFRLLAYS